jgi:uncharacterized membrane protein
MKMTKVEARIEINKPVKEVFAYASDWKHWDEWREGPSGLKPVTKIERGNGARYTYRASIAFMKFNLETEIHYFKENVGWQGIVQKGFPHKMNWVFESRGVKTRVIHVLEYSPPFNLIGPLLDFFILKPNLRRMSEKSLSNLKVLLEE